MKRPRSGETELETGARLRRTEVIDGIYALTPEWQVYDKITPRRRLLLGHPPGFGDTRSMTDGIERTIHEELASQLSHHNPQKRQRLLSFKEAHEFAGTLYREVSSPEPDVSGKPKNERIKDLLIEFVRNLDAITTAHQLIIMLIAKSEREGSLVDTPMLPLGGDAEFFEQLALEIEDISSPFLAALPSPELCHVFAQRWPWFNRREWSMLTTAFSQAEDQLDPFLEYLEAREGGRGILARWCQWNENADWEAVMSYYYSANVLLRDWIKGQALLYEIEDEDDISYEERLQVCVWDLCEIGAILICQQPDQPPKVSYRLYSQRKKGIVPSGWDVLSSQATGLELGQYLTEFVERDNVYG